jgi:hypothetical protein
VERTGHKSLPLILAREFASNVAVPIFLVDDTNTLVYYNDAAAVAFGGPFGQTGELRHGEWAARFNPSKPDGTPYDRKELPLVIALEERRPAHGVNLVTSSTVIAGWSSSRRCRCSAAPTISPVCSSRSGKRRPDHACARLGMPGINCCAGAGDSSVRR